MALPQDGQNANGLTKVTEIPKGKELIFIDPTTNEGGIITLEDLTTQILKNLTSQTFALDQGTMTLLQALNQLNSNRFKCRTVSFVDVTIPASGYLAYSAMTKKEGTNNIPPNSLFACVSSYGAVNPKVTFTACTAYLLGEPGANISSLSIMFIYS